jgi:hypothetical protein
MDLLLLLTFASGGLVFVGALGVLYAGIQRLRGKRSRFDGLFETVVRADRAGVYPPSLRGNPDPQVEEDREVSRGDVAVRSTPGERLRASDKEHPGAV